jgi:hypothetical protein
MTVSLMCVLSEISFNVSEGVVCVKDITLLSPKVVTPLIISIAIILYTDEKNLQFRLRVVHAEGPFFLLAHST